jgi:hypothetical protein
MNTSRSHSIIVFLKEDGNGVRFPFSPEQVWDEAFSLHCISYKDSYPLTETMDAEAQYQCARSFEIAKRGGLLQLVADVIHAPENQNNIIYTVHPNNILLPLYKWYLMRQNVTMSSLDTYIQRLSRITVDICEVFHKPMVLTLDRRQNFNYETVARWMDIPKDSALSEEENCLKVLKYICHKL